MWKKNCKKKILVLRTKFNGMKDIIMEIESVIVSCKFEKKRFVLQFYRILYHKSYFNICRSFNNYEKC